MLASKVPYFLDRKLDTLNAAIDSEGPNTFVSTIFNENFPVNFTMTKAPEFRPADDLIEIHMDGRVVSSNPKSAWAGENSEWQPRVAAKQLEQFFIHESVANTFMAALQENYMPLMV